MCSVLLVSLFSISTMCYSLSRTAVLMSEASHIAWSAIACLEMGEPLPEDGDGLELSMEVEFVKCDVEVIDHGAEALDTGAQDGGIGDTPHKDLARVTLAVRTTAGKEVLRYHSIVPQRCVYRNGSGESGARGQHGDCRDVDRRRAFSLDAVTFRQAYPFGGLWH